MAGDKRTVDAFRTDCLRELTKIRVAWPDLNYSTGKGVLVLLPSKPAVPPTAPSARGMIALTGPLPCPEAPSRSVISRTKRSWGF